MKLSSGLEVLHVLQLEGVLRSHLCLVSGSLCLQLGYDHEQACKPK